MNSFLPEVWYSLVLGTGKQAGKWSVTTADNIRGVVGSAQIWTENKTKSLVVFQERF